jgi:hypothetical protein
MDFSDSANFFSTEGTIPRVAGRASSDRIKHVLSPLAPLELGANNPRILKTGIYSEDN